MLNNEPTVGGLKAGEIVYLRARVLGFDTDYDGMEKAVCAPCDAAGNHDDAQTWFFRERDLVKAGVLAASVQERVDAAVAKELAKRQ